MTNSQLSFVPLIKDCQVFMTQQIEPHVQKSVTEIVVSSHVSLNGMCVFLCVWAHKRMSTLVCMCLWVYVDQMCQCAGGVDEKLPQSEVPCGQHSGRAGTKSNL